MFEKVNFDPERFNRHPILYKKLVTLCRIVSKPLMGIKVHGLENLPNPQEARAQNKAVVFVANHRSWLDVFPSFTTNQYRPRVMAKDKLWTKKLAGLPIGKYVLRPLIETLGAYPVFRSEDSIDTNGPNNSSVHSFTLDEINALESIANYPEGGVRKGPTIGKLKTSLARAALQSETSGVLFVPVGIAGTEESGLRTVLRHKTDIYYGKPIEITPLTASPEKHLLEPGKYNDFKSGPLNESMEQIRLAMQDAFDHAIKLNEIRR